MFKGLVTLISGGGVLGRVTAESLIKQGGKVVMCDVLNSNGPTFTKKLGENATFTPMDLTSEPDVMNALQLTSETYGRLDVAIICANMALNNQTNFKNKDPFDTELFQKIIDHDLVGTFNVLRLAAGLIGENTPDKDGMRGVIINVSSTAAYDSNTGREAYSACREGLSTMVLPITRDLSKQGIRVLTVIPEVFKIKENLKEPVTESFPSGENYPTEFVHMIETILENPMLNGEVIRLDQFREEML